MIPKHPQFLEAINDKKKISVRFYSQPDSGVLDRVCAPLAYGPGADAKDGLNRYWLWDYASDPGLHTLSLLPQQIVDLQVLGEGFDPAEFAGELPPTKVAQTVDSPSTVVSSSAAATPTH